MKKILLIIALFISVTINAQKKKVEIKDQVVEASCGQCNFGMKGSGCTLAVKFDNQKYFVDGTDIDDHGDAHSEEGFCMKVKKAKVSGAVINDKFVVSKFEVIPDKKNNKQQKK